MSLVAHDLLPEGVLGEAFRSPANRKNLLKKGEPRPTSTIVEFQLY